jgi:hypothetical protein
MQGTTVLAIGPCANLAGHPAQHCGMIAPDFVGYIFEFVHNRRIDGDAHLDIPFAGQCLDDIGASARDVVIRLEFWISF